MILRDQLNNSYNQAVKLNYRKTGPVKWLTVLSWKWARWRKRLRWRGFICLTDKNWESALSASLIYADKYRLRTQVINAFYEQSELLGEDILYSDIQSRVERELAGVETEERK